MLNILIGFLPWILYSVFSGRIAMIVALAAILIFDRKDLKAGFILPCCTFAYFSVLLMVSLFYHSHWLMQNMWLISNGVLACISFGSAIIKQPFTMQYAKKQTPEAYWSSPLFLEINYILTIAWGFLFLVGAFTNYLHVSHWHLQGFTYFIVNNIGWAIGAYFTAVFPGYWKKRKINQLKRSQGKTGKKAVSEFLEGNYAPWRSEDHFSNLEIIGKIPDDLNGVLLRNGPNPQFDPLDEYHWFEGDGMVHAIRIHNGKASYDNRWIRTNKFKAENKAGKILFGTAMGDASVDEAMRNTGNTNIIAYHNKLLALNEGSLPVEMQLNKLTTIGDYTFEKQMTRPHTAHPRFDHKRQEHITYSYANDDGKLLYYRFDKENKLIAEKEIAWPYMCMMHDFVNTENYVIFPVFPCTISVERAIKGESMMMWEGDQLKTIFIITDRDGNEVTRIETDPCYVYHFGNAYENGDEMIIDAMINDTVPLMPDRHGKTQNGNARLGRWKINIKTNTISLQFIDHTRCEFPRFDERFNGYAYHHLYAAADQKEVDRRHKPFDCVIHYDLKNNVKRVHDFKNDVPWEPVFVAKSEKEGYGYLLFPVYRTNEDRSDIVILDANDITKDPIAIIKIPHRIPYGFHGNFVSM